jgi:tetratricopeptide (TPR) repeat protein
LSGERLAALRRGDELTELGRYDSAAAVFAEVLRADPEDVSAMCGLSNCMLGLRRHREGLEVASRAVALDPERVMAHCLRGRHLLALHRRREALAAAAEAVRLGPDDYFALLTLFEAQHRRRDRREAAKTAQRLVERHPSRAEPHNAVGRAALLTRNWTGAERAFREALRLRPSEPVYQTNLAIALERQGRKGAALELFERAVRTDPGSSQARRQLAHAIDRRVAAFVGFGVMGVWAVVQIARIVPRPNALAVLGAAAVVVMAAVVALCWWWLRRLEEPVRRLYRWERRSGRPLRLARAAYVGGLLLAVLLTVGVVALIDRSPGTLAGTLFVALWAVLLAGPRLWRRWLLPRLESRFAVPVRD